LNEKGELKSKKNWGRSLATARIFYLPDGVNDINISSHILEWRSKVGRWWDKKLLKCSLRAACCKWSLSFVFNQSLPTGLDWNRFLLFSNMELDFLNILCFCFYSFLPPFFPINPSFQDLRFLSHPETIFLGNNQKPGPIVKSHLLIRNAGRAGTMSTDWRPILFICVSSLT
jgi:hypothetical protein